MENKYLTAKCNHNERGRCINCLSKKLRQEKMLQEQASSDKPRAQFADKSQQPAFNKCNHPANAKCINCLPREQLVKGQCNHPPTIKCQHCIQKERYTDFKQYLRRLQEDCAHKKPCMRCLPPQDLYYFINKSCRNHIPYPQAMCNACLPPTVSIRKQTYTHVREVVFKTFDVYRFLDVKNQLAFLYGTEESSKEGGVILSVEAIYLPRRVYNQSTKEYEIYEDEFEQKLSNLTDTMGLKRIGMMFDSVDLTHQQLVHSARYQDLHQTTESKHVISNFITVRVIRHPETNESEGIQCYMVSDQFQTFEKNNLLYKLPNMNEFGLQVAIDKRDNLPTYLRGGIETDRFQFEQAMVWVSSKFNCERDCYTPYAFFNVSVASLDDMENYLDIHRTLEMPERFMHNFQFLLDVMSKMGIETAINLCICCTEEDIMEVEKRVSNWITEERSSSLLNKEKQRAEQQNMNVKNGEQHYAAMPKQQPTPQQMMQSRIYQEEELQRRYLQEQEEKMIRKLQEREWMNEQQAMQNEFAAKFRDPSFLQEQKDYMRILELEDMKKRKQMKQFKEEQMKKKQQYPEQRNGQPFVVKPPSHTHQHQAYFKQQQKSEQQKLEQQRLEQQRLDQKKMEEQMMRQQQNRDRQLWEQQQRQQQRLQEQQRAKYQAQQAQQAPQPQVIPPGKQPTLVPQQPIATEPPKQKTNFLTNLFKKQQNPPQPPTPENKR